MHSLGQTRAILHNRSMQNDDAVKFTRARLPQFNSIDFTTLEQRLRALLEGHRAHISRLSADQAAENWQHIADPLETLADELQRFFSPIGHLHSVANDESLRRSYKTCVALIAEYRGEIVQNRQLVAAYERLRSSAEFELYDNAKRRVVLNALRDARLGGVSLPAAKQDRVRTLLVELSELATRFEDNVLDATQAFRLRIGDEDRLVGLPDPIVALARQNAVDDNAEGWVLTLDMSCYMPAMMHLDDRRLRRELYEAYSTRASDQGPSTGNFDNSEIIRTILRKRKELALLLGFSNYAEMSLETKMAASTDVVFDFLGELAEKARPEAQRELDELNIFADRHLNIADIEAWDISYCSEKLRQHKFSLAQDELKPYFPIARVIDGMFKVTAQLFDLTYEKLFDIETWHPDVKFFSVTGSDGQVCGFFYLDLYARKHKRPGAWMDECLVRRRHASALQLPVAYLTCNFTPPVAEQPTLLTHDEVITLFHEFGHGLHHLLTTIDRPAVSGINGVPWDAVELPSQILENWCWERESLDIISGHFETGVPIPAQLYDRLTATRSFQAAMQLVRQIEFALFDFRAHTDPNGETDIQTLIDNVRDEVSVVTPPAYNRFQNSFSHVFAGGYAAGYYSYKWSEVLSADAFSLFKENGVLNRETGLKFRSSILESGGAEDAMVLFAKFRGRAPSIEPLLRQAGLHVQ